MTVGLLVLGASGVVLHLPLEGCSSAEPTPKSVPEPKDAGAVALPDAGVTVPLPSLDAALDANSCEPGDVSKFKPLWKPPTPFHQGLCTMPQIAAFKTTCLGSGASPSACGQFNVTGTVEQKCAACIKSQESDLKYGPIVERKGFVELNLAGCISNVLNDPKGGGCAGSYQASLQCVSSACSSNCPVASDPSFKEYQSCSQQASENGCKAYAENAKCVEQLAEAGSEVPSQCLSGNSFSERYDVMVPLFCAGPTDGGAG